MLAHIATGSQYSLSPQETLTCSKYHYIYVKLKDIVHRLHQSLNGRDFLNIVRFRIPTKLNRPKKIRAKLEDASLPFSSLK